MEGLWDSVIEKTLQVFPSTAMDASKATSRPMQAETKGKLELNWSDWLKFYFRVVPSFPEKIREIWFKKSGIFPDYTRFPGVGT